MSSTDKPDWFYEADPIAPWTAPVFEFYFYCPVCREEFDSDGQMFRCPECLYSDYDDVEINED